MITRETASQKLINFRDAFWFSLGAYALLTQEPSRSQLSLFTIQVSELDTIAVGTGSLPLPSRGTSYTIGFNSALDTASARRVVEHTFRQMILQSFEVTKAYASSSDPGVITEPWFQFARQYRNAVAHSGRWDIRSRNGLPLVWRRKTVSFELHGSSIDGYLTWYEGLQLCAQMINFVSQGIR